MWMYSDNFIIMDYFLLTKIAGGYAYYSTAAATDGGRVWDCHQMSSGDIANGEYVGVVKIPVDGPVVSQIVLYEHLELLMYLRYHPRWYKILYYEPNYFRVFLNEAKTNLNIRTYDKLEGFKKNFNMVYSLGQMFDKKNK